jgi:hypothetical protein
MHISLCNNGSQPNHWLDFVHWHAEHKSLQLHSYSYFQEGNIYCTWEVSTTSALTGSKRAEYLEGNIYCTWEASVTSAPSHAARERNLSSNQIIPKMFKLTLNAVNRTIKFKHSTSACPKSWNRRWWTIQRIQQFIAQQTHNILMANKS